MEIELKYIIPDGETGEAIWQNELFGDWEEPDSREEILCDAKYFDTDSCELAKNEIAYRVRQEGDKLVASLKWKGHSEDGLHVREEINVPVDCDSPNPEVFRESNVGSQVMDLLQDKELKCFMETIFKRRRFRIDTGTGIFEFSIDRGEIITNKGKERIDEVEIELFSGETEELLHIGERLAKKYDLVAEDSSKYARGIAMMEDK